MHNYVEEYKIYLTDDKKSSKNTIDGYIRDINNYAEFCTEKNKDNPFLVDTVFFKNYVEILKSEGKSASSIQRIISSIRSFYKFLIQKNYVTTNPTAYAKMSKSVNKTPGILDTDEVMLLLSQPSGNDLKSRRDKAILETMYATGLKVSELISIKISDVNTSIGILNICSEKGHQRIVPIYSKALKALNDYINNVRPMLVLDSGVEDLFTNMNGQALSRQGLWKIIKYYSEKACIDKDITPHTLRHSFAAHLLENGADIKDIKEMLGHSDISSTQVYAQILKNKYTKSYEKYHPLAKYK